MTEAEAIELAAKREHHKSKYMTHKRWAAIHDSVKGWHVALVDNALPAPGGDAGVSLAGIIMCAAMFGPAATAQALAMLARRDERTARFPTGGILKQPPGRVTLIGENSKEFIIPLPRKKL